MSTFSTSSRQKRLKTLSFYTFDFEMCFVPQRRALFRHFFDIWTSKSGPRPSVFNTFDLEMCFAPQRRALFPHHNFQKSRHNGVHFFDISTPKSGPTLRCFLHFDLEMCFAPQRRALFRRRHFQKWSENGVFCTFSLGNVLRATTACNFSSLLWPAGSAPAALASLLFDPPEPQIIGKTQCFETFLPFRASVSSVLLLFLFWSFSSLCLFPALLFISPYCRKFDF